jgi:hypothetical protein
MRFRNLGRGDRVSRVVTGAALAAVALIVHLALPWRALFVGVGGYLLASAIAAHCVVHRLRGTSTIDEPDWPPDDADLRWRDPAWPPDHAEG